MYIVLPAASHFEYIVADRIGHPFGIIVAKNFAHFHAGDAISCNGFLCDHKTPVDKGSLALDSLDLIALRDFIPFVDKAVIGSDDKPVCIRTGRDAADQVGDFRNRLLTGDKDFILGIRLVSTSIDLIVVHIHDLFAGEDAAQLGDLERLDVVKLDTSAVLAVLMQNCFTLGKIVARHTIDQHLEIVRHRQLCVWKQRCHAETGIGWQNTELDFQLRCTFWVILHPAEQFLAHLIAHGIRDDDHRAFLGILQIAGIEISLQGQCHKCVRFLNSSIPLGKQRFQILVGIDVFHQIAQRLESCRFFELIVSGIEAAIFVVQPEVLLLILAQNLFEAVRATVISSLNDLIGAVKHLIAASGLFPKVQFAPLLADLRDGQAIQCRPHILSQKPLHNPFCEGLVNGKEGIAVH